MKYLSVCSGIEAATVAWHGLGWEPVAFAEIEKFPAAVLAHHYPEVPNLGDMTLYRDWPEAILAEVDLLVGGTPCQAFSIGWLKTSLADERGNLSLTFVNLHKYINEVRRRHGRPPAIVVWENVPGVLSTKDNAFGCLLGGLLGTNETPETEKGRWDNAGFLSSETSRVGYRILDAQYFAVAQRRRRVFLVAVPGELAERFGERACPSAILSIRESVLGGSAPREPSTRETSGCIGERTEEGDHPPVKVFRKSRRAQSVADYETWVESPVAPTQNQFDGGDVRATVIAICNSRGGAARRITPSECEALQGFPTGYTAVPYRNKPAADGPRYKALGNSMAVPCMWWIGDRIKKATQPT